MSINSILLILILQLLPGMVYLQHESLHAVPTDMLVRISPYIVRYLIQFVLVMHSGFKTTRTA